MFNRIQAFSKPGFKGPQNGYYRWNFKSICCSTNHTFINQCEQFELNMKMYIMPWRKIKQTLYLTTIQANPVKLCSSQSFYCKVLHAIVLNFDCISDFTTFRSHVYIYAYNYLNKYYPTLYKAILFEIFKLYK